MPRKSSAELFSPRADWPTGAPWNSDPRSTLVQIPAVVDLQPGSRVESLRLLVCTPAQPPLPDPHSERASSKSAFEPQPKSSLSNCPPASVVCNRDTGISSLTITTHHPPILRQDAVPEDFPHQGQARQGAEAEPVRRSHRKPQHGTQQPAISK